MELISLAQYFTDLKLITDLKSQNWHLSSTHRLSYSLVRT